MFKKILISTFLVLGLGLFYSNSQAQSQTVPDQSVQGGYNSGQSVYSKDLNISATDLSSGGSINGTFTAYNVSSDPADNYYSKISLINKTGSDTEVLDSVSGQSFSLVGNESKNIAFSYQVPNVSGNLVFRVSVFNERGLEISRLEKNITVSGDIKILDIVSSSVVVDGKTFSLEEGPTIYSTSSAYVLIDLKNTTGGLVTVTPNTQIFKKTISSGVSIGSFSGQAFTLNNGEEKKIKVDIQLPATPEVYEGQITFSGSNDITIPQIAFRFIVAGEIATIQSVSLGDQTLGDNSSLSIVVSYTGTPTDISNGQTEGNYPVSIKVDLVDDQGRSVGSGNTNTILADSGSEVIPVLVNIKQDPNITANVSITSESGNVISSGKYLLGKIIVQSSDNNIFTLTNIIYAVVTLALVIIIILMIYMKKRSRPMMVLLALIFSGGLIFGISEYKANAQSGGSTYVKSIGCSYKKLQIDHNTSSKQYSVDSVTTYLIPCSVDQINTITNTYQYVTFNPKLTSTSSKYYAAVKTGSGSINYDRSGQVCTIVDAKGKISTINNCAEGNDQSDSLSFDNTTNCTIDYTSGGKSVEKTYPNCSIIDSTGGGGSCSYFYGGKIITVNNCQSIKDNSTDYTINTNYCSVFYTYTTGTGKNIKTKSTSKSYANCSNIAYDALTGICTYDLKGKPNQTQNNCTGIINYAVNTMDIEFLYTPSPGNDGKIVLNAGDTESFTSYLYYTKCTNSPGSATASFTMLDPDGQVVPGSYFKGKVSSGTTDSDKHVSETVKGEFDESFTAPSKPGRYTILYTVTDTSKYKSSGAKTGYFNFWVKDSGHTCTVNSVCRSVANSCGNTNQGVVTSCDQSGSEVCSIDTKIAPPEPASGICAACVPTYSCSNGKVVNNCDSVTKDCAAYGLVCSNSGGCTNAGGVTIDPLTQNNDGTPKAAVSIKSTIVSPNTVNPYDVIKDPAGGNCNLSWELNQYDASSTCSIYKGNSLTSSSPFTPSSSKGTYSDQKITNETNYKLSCGETDATNSLIPTSVVSKYATCYINSSYTETNR